MTENIANIPVPVEEPWAAPSGRLAEYLKAGLPDLRGEVRFLRFPGGNSNLTFLAQSDDVAFVLKREPPGAKSKSAHDMRREFRVLSALADAYPLAPRPLLLCEDPDVFGGVFLVMQRVDGLIVRGPADGGEALPRQFEALIDALATLHLLDATAQPFTELGRAAGYRERQTLGWIRRFNDATLQPNLLAAHVADWLATNIPTDPERAAVIHNDFKMDNLVWDRGAPHRLAAVLDWEMATVGDPLMDLACTLSFWMEAGDRPELLKLRSMPSAVPGVMTRREAFERYSRQAAAPVSDFAFYRCFGLFRRAAIEQQKFHRFVTGQTEDERFRELDGAVQVLLTACLAELEH